MKSIDRYINPRRHPLANIAWSAAALGLLIFLGWQVKYFLVEKYAQHESYRPHLARFCKLAACRLPPLRDATRFTLTHTKIDLHRRQPGALRVTVKLVNEAIFAQPYPDLRLTLTDRDGRIVGQRVFSPTAYLGAGQADALASGELGVALLDLASPHEKAVGFEVGVVAGVVSS